MRSFEEDQPREYPEHLEAGTLNGHGLSGLGAAVDFILETGVETIHAHERSLTERFVEGLRELDGVTIYGDFSGDRAPVVALNLEGWDPASAADELSVQYDIAVRPASTARPGCTGRWGLRTPAVCASPLVGTRPRRTLTRPWPL